TVFTELRVPSVPTLKTLTPELATAAYTKRPVGSMRTAAGVEVVEMVPVKGVNTPEVEFTLYPEIVLAPTFAAYTKRAEGSTVMEAGVSPAGKGDPETSVRAPVVRFTVKPEMPPVWLET